MDPRHPAIVRWTDIEDPRPWQYDADDEPMGLDADVSTHFGLKRIGIHHHRLLPGRRSSFPHAESVEDECVVVLEGTPDVWLDGRLHRLGPDDTVGFPAGTGLAHAFLNNTDTDVRLLVVGDRLHDAAQTAYPLNLDRKPQTPNWWDDAPPRDLGPHDGLTDARRAALASKG